VIAVLKQERFEVYQEALALTASRQPAHQVERDGRQVEGLGGGLLRFSDRYPGPVRWSECVNGGGSAIASGGAGCTRTRSRTDLGRGG